jgi:hypothetical protein
LDYLVENPDELSIYYGPVLGSPTTFIRDFAAKTFTVMIRKLSLKQFKLHFKKLLKSCNSQIVEVMENDFQSFSEYFDEFDLIKTSSSDNSENEKESIPHSVRRCRFLCDGIMKLLFNSLKGIQGCLHSKSLKRFDSLFQAYLKFFSTSTQSVEKEHIMEQDKEGSGDEDDQEAEMEEEKEEHDSPDVVKNQFLLKFLSNIYFTLLQKFIFRYLYVENQFILLNQLMNSFVLPALEGMQSPSSVLRYQEIVIHLNLSFLLLFTPLHTGKTKYHVLFFNSSSSLPSETMGLVTKKTMKNKEKSQNPLVNLFLQSAFNLYSLIHENKKMNVENSTFSENLMMRSRESIVKLWLLFPNSNKFSTDFIPLLTDSIQYYSPKECLLYFTEELYAVLPVNNVTRNEVLLPVLLNGALELFQDSSNHSVSKLEWLDVVYRLLTLINDSRDNTDIVLKIRNENEAGAKPELRWELFENLFFKTLELFTIQIPSEVTSASLSDESNHLFHLLIKIMSWFSINIKDLFLNENYQKQNKKMVEKYFKYIKSLKVYLTNLLIVPCYGIICDSVVFYYYLSEIGSTLDTSYLKIFTKKLLFFYMQKPTSIILSSTLAFILDEMAVLEEEEGEEGNANTATAEKNEKYLLNGILTESERSTLLQALSEGFATSSFYLKYYLCRILSYLEPPTLYYEKKILKEDAGNEQSLPRVFDIANVFSEIVLTPLNVANERQILRRLEIIEVYSRHNKLSKDYLILIVGFTCGLFYLKYKPVWNAAINVLMTICTPIANVNGEDSEPKPLGGEEIVWPVLANFLEKTSKQSEFMELSFLSNESVKENNFVSAGTILDNLEKYDCIDVNYLEDIKECPYFYMSTGKETRQLPVQPDAVTDNETIYSVLLEFLRKSPVTVVIKKSKPIIEHFISFLNYIFYPNHVKDPELPGLRKIGLLLSKEQLDPELVAQFSFLTQKERIKRLENFMKVFAAVPSPKQMSKYGLLFAFYNELLCKSDTAIAKLAFDCILTYKPAYLMPYKDSLKNLYDEKLLRNELVNIDSENVRSAEGGGNEGEKDYRISADHKKDFYHVILRILYGRLLSKPSGGSKRNVNDQITSRRSAVIAFIIRTNVPAFKHFLYFMIRGINLSIDFNFHHATNPAAKKKDVMFTSDIGKVEEFLSSGFERVLAYYNSHPSSEANVIEEEFKHVSWERLQGFLHLLHPIFKIFGIAMKDYVNLLYSILKRTLIHAQRYREKTIEMNRITAEEDALEEGNEKELQIHQVFGEEEEDNAEKNTASGNEISLAVGVRTLALQRLAEFFEFYHEIVKITNHETEIFPFIKPLLISFPSAIALARKKPALLTLLETLSAHEITLPIVASQPVVVENIIRCISYSKLEINISKSIFILLNNVFQNGEIVKKYLLNYTQLLITSFSTRFHPTIKQQQEEHGSSSSLELLKISDVVFKDLFSLHLELQLLSHVTAHIFHNKSVVISNTLITNFATILLGILRSYFNSKKLRIFDDWILNLLKVYQSIVWRMDDISGHFIFISRLFGAVATFLSPTAIITAGMNTSSGAAILFNKNIIRKEILATYDVMCGHPSLNKDISKNLMKVMNELVNYENKMMNSNRNLDSFIPAMKSLSSENGQYTWNIILGPEAFAKYSQTDKNDKTPKKKETKEISVPAKAGVRSVENHLLICSAILFECIRSLYEEEYSIRSAALYALKKLITDLFTWNQSFPSANDEWLSIIKTVLIPGIHKGIEMSLDSVKTSFISLLAHIIRYACKYPCQDPRNQEAFHTDLFPLMDENDPEQDFFENICHLQLHRRARAFTKLKNVLLNKKGDQNPLTFTISTFNHILLPIAFYYLTGQNEFTKKIHRQFLNEIAQFVGAICFNLPFNHYLNVMKKIIKLLERNAMKNTASDKEEKIAILQIALIAVLDSFHFDLYQPLQAGKVLAMEPVAVAVGKKKSKKQKKEKKSSTQQRAAESDREDDDEASDDERNRKAGESDREDENEEEEKNDDEEEVDTDSENASTDEETEAEEKPEVKRTLVIGDVVLNYMFPTIKSFLLKETKDQKNNKTKMVQSNIAIALVNLLKQLTPPLVDVNRKLDIFSNMIIDIIETLKSRDVHVRDSTRACLTKIITILGFQSFERILFEIQSILKEGYQRHVALYTIRSVLTQITQNYQPPADAKLLSIEELSDLQNEAAAVDQSDGNKNKTEEPLSYNQKQKRKAKLDTLMLDFFYEKGIQLPDFDHCIPLIMNFVILDLSDEIREERENTEGIIRSSIREVKGNKFNEILEILATCLLFRPTYALLSPQNPSLLSSIHAISVPLLEFLNNHNNPDDHSDAVRTGRVAEALHRVALGLSKNPSLDVKELLLYIHASLQPFVSLMLQQYRRYKESSGKIVDLSMRKDEDQNNKKKNKKRKKNQELAAAQNKPNVMSYLTDESDLELVLPSYLREESSDEEESFSFMRKKTKNVKNDPTDVSNFKAATWLPTDWNSIKEQKAVIEERNRQQKELVRVEDGASAPKMTGRNRYDKAKRALSGNNGIEKSTLIAIKYCLTLLLTCLKRGIFKSDKTSVADVLPGTSSVNEVVQEMLIPFIPMLRSFLHIPNASEIMILSIKSLSQLISQGIYFDPKTLNAITNRVLMIVMQYNSSKITTENELCQSCLTLLLSAFKRYNHNHRLQKLNRLRQQQLFQQQLENANEEDVVLDEIKDIRTADEQQTTKKQQQSLSFLSSMIDYPLQERKMRLLVESLTLSLLDPSSTTSYQMLIYQLIREIILTHILLPEIYDLMMKLADQIVLSNFKNIRLLSSKILLEFLIYYPMTKQKHLHMFKKLLSLCDFQYAEGKLSAYETIHSMIKLFPLPVIEDYSNMLFLSMTLKLSNEKASNECIQMVMNILLFLLTKIQDKNLLHQMEDYIMKWLETIVTRINRITNNSHQQKSQQQHQQQQQEQQYSVELRSSMIQAEQNISQDMIELVTIGSKLFIIFLNSLKQTAIKNQTHKSNHSDKKFNDDNLTKSQRELIKKFYLIVYENILLFLQFHFLNYNSVEDALMIMSNQNNNNVKRKQQDEEEEEDHLISYLFSSPASSLTQSTGSHHHGNVMIPLKEKYWHVLYQLLMVFDTSYQWNATFIDHHLLLIHQKIMNSTDSFVCSFLSKGQLSWRLFIEVISELLFYNHPWIRNVSIRILTHYLEQRILLGGNSDSKSAQNYLQRLVVKNKNNDNNSSSSLIANEILLKPNSFYFISRKLCLLMNQKHVKDDFSPFLKKSLLLMITCMHENGELDTPIPDKYQMIMSDRKTRSEKEAGQQEEEEEGENEEHNEERDEEEDDDEEIFDEIELPKKENEEFELMNFKGKLSNFKNIINEESEMLDGNQEEEEEEQRKEQRKEQKNKRKQENRLKEEGNENDDEENEAIADDTDEEVEPDVEEKEDEAMEVGGEEEDDNMNKQNPDDEQEQVEEEEEVEVEALNEKVFFEEGEEKSNKRGLVWVMNRLRAIGADSRGTRRIRVLQLFYDLVQSQTATPPGSALSDLIKSFLPKIMEIPIRVLYTYSRKKTTHPNDTGKASMISTASEDLLEHLENISSAEENLELQYLLSMKLLALLEQQCASCPDVYLDYYTKIQAFLEQKKLVKKSSLKMEAITNPQAYAEKRVRNDFSCSSYSYFKFCFFFSCFNFFISCNGIEKRFYNPKENYRSSWCRKGRRESFPVKTSFILKIKKENL